MIYPQLSGEPNFVLIGVAAVFGLIIIIVMYYIVTNKNQRMYKDYSTPTIKKNLAMNNNSNSISNSNSKKREKHKTRKYSKK